jgi:DNA-binding CsgD family transcriptional regulator
MKRHVLICGMVGGVLIAMLKWMEYRFLVLEHAVDLYAALIAVIFAALGVWLGSRIDRKTHPVTNAPAVAVAGKPALPDEKRREDLGITRRELEILGLVAQGMSNREIAARLFVSENTVKTHCSRAFDKLGAKRRTQAVQLGKELGLLP